MISMISRVQSTERSHAQDIHLAVGQNQGKSP